MKKITKGWPPERRKKQAELMRQRKPWKKSTGPKTTEGKSVSSRNGLKHGLRSAEMAALRKTLRTHRQTVKFMVAIAQHTATMQ